ncbi:hypothetical protein LDENG_00016460 [Lucifuga dentata]|nr:hypothetical protein LDENG_00016460 [Lucifuga dentata]
MIVSNVTCMKTGYIRLKHSKWPVWSFNPLVRAFFHFKWVMEILLRSLFDKCRSSFGTIFHGGDIHSLHFLLHLKIPNF